ncbi:zinc-dependent metalloprotease [Pseudokineococcus basanitobsidens]|uniref:Zinc-dependent metalloprotease n=1 Tax=Pseudokineococcus basanitobsidens TaxID=1926649 RepID=A0ABU8RJL0_9ACTN
MSQTPPGRPGDDEGGEPRNPFEELLRQIMGGGAGGGPFAGVDPAALQAAGLPADPAAMGAMMAQVQQMMAGGGDGPVNWDLARQVARQRAAADGDPSVGDSARRATAEALRLADLWLAERTELGEGGASGVAWSRSEWVEATLPVWRQLAEPVAHSVGDAMAAAMAEQAPPELRPMMATAGGVVRQVGGAVFGMQVGQAVGELAGEVVSGTDIGLPLVPAGTAALLPANVDAFAEGLEVPLEDVRLYLALREVAHVRLFGARPWLRAHVLGIVEAFARGIRIDTGRIEEAVRSVDPTDPEALQQALGSGMLEPERTPEQDAALLRLETVLALVEGWVDHVVGAAAAPLPSAGALREVVRRRRAAGGPAEHTLSSLVGLELRPRRLRDAAALWAAVEAEHGVDGRDRAWSHPDLLPTAEDLDDPSGYAARRSTADSESADVDAALEQLLGGDLGEARRERTADERVADPGDEAGDDDGAGAGPR